MIATQPDTVCEALLGCDRWTCSGALTDCGAARSHKQLHPKRFLDSLELGLPSYTRSRKMVNYGCAGMKTVEFRPSKTLVPQRDSQKAPTWANGSSNVEIPLQCRLVFNSTNGGG